jgi:hypothetical protein
MVDSWIYWIQLILLVLLIGLNLSETFVECSFLFKFKEGKNFNRRHTPGIPRIKIFF